MLKEAEHASDRADREEVAARIAQENAAAAQEQMEADLAWERMIEEEMAAEIAAEIGEWDSAMSSILDPDKDETVLAPNVFDDDKELVPKATISILEERGRVV